MIHRYISIFLLFFLYKYFNTKIESANIPENTEKSIKTIRNSQLNNQYFENYFDEYFQTNAENTEKESCSCDKFLIVDDNDFNLYSF